MVDKRVFAKIYNCGSFIHLEKLKVYLLPLNV